MRIPGKSIFSPPKPKVSEPAPLPTREDPAIAEAQRLEREKARTRGRRKTLLTSGEGVEGGAPVERKTLLGQ